MPQGMDRALPGGKTPGPDLEEQRDGKPTSFRSCSGPRGRFGVGCRLARAAGQCRSPSTWQAAAGTQGTNIGTVSTLAQVSVARLPQGRSELVVTVDYSKN